MAEKRQALTTEQRAWCALQWRCGRTQREIGAELGLKSAVPICIAINAFMVEHLPDHVDRSGYCNTPRVIEFGVRRKALVDAALREYIRRGGNKPRIRLPPELPAGTENTEA